MQRRNNLGGLTSGEWEQLQALVGRYETVSAKADTVDLGQFLPPEDDPLRPLALQELVKCDLEIRWRHAKPILVEEYLRRFPELERDGALVPRLLDEEFRVRQRYGDKPAL